MEPSKNNSIPITNVVFGVICWVALTTGIIIYLMRVDAARKQGRRWCAMLLLSGIHALDQKLPAAIWTSLLRTSKQSIKWIWHAVGIQQVLHTDSQTGAAIHADRRSDGPCFRKPRRRKLAVLLFTELITQWINITFFLIPNIYLLCRPCSMFSSLVREHACPPSLLGNLTEYQRCVEVQLRLEAENLSRYLDMSWRARGPFAYAPEGSWLSSKCADGWAVCSLLCFGALNVLEHDLPHHPHPNAQRLTLLENGCVTGRHLHANICSEFSCGWEIRTCFGKNGKGRSQWVSM